MNNEVAAVLAPHNIPIQKERRFPIFSTLFALFLIVSISSGYPLTDAFDADVSGLYQKYDGSSTLTIKTDGSFTIYQKSTNTLMTGKWKLKGSGEIQLLIGQADVQTTFQIYGNSLFHNGYLVWRKRL